MGCTNDTMYSFTKVLLVLVASPWGDPHHRMGRMNDTVQFDQGHTRFVASTWGDPIHRMGRTNDTMCSFTRAILDVLLLPGANHMTE